MASNYQHLYGRPDRSNAECVVPNPNRSVRIAKDVYLPDNVWHTHTDRAVPQAQRENTRPYAQAASIGLRQSMRNEAKAKGVRGSRLDLSKALLIAMALFVVLGMFTLVNRSALLDANDRLMIARRGLEQLATENSDLLKAIEQAKEETDIGYRAANELGMIRASDAQTIALVAVDAYPEQPAQTGYTAQVVVQGWGEMQPETMLLSANAQ